MNILPRSALSKEKINLYTQVKKEISGKDYRRYEWEFWGCASLLLILSFQLDVNSTSEKLKIIRWKNRQDDLRFCGLGAWLFKEYKGEKITVNNEGALVSLVDRWGLWRNRSTTLEHSYFLFFLVFLKEGGTSFQSTTVIYSGSWLGLASRSSS